MAIKCDYTPAIEGIGLIGQSIPSETLAHPLYDSDTSHGITIATGQMADLTVNIIRRNDPALTKPTTVCQYQDHHTGVPDSDSHGIPLYTRRQRYLYPSQYCMQIMIEIFTGTVPLSLTGR